MSEIKDSGENKNENAGADVQVAEQQDSEVTEQEVLADPDLPASDFERARTDPKFMEELVSKRAEKPVEIPEKADAADAKKVESEEEKDKGEVEPKKRKRGGFKRLAERAKDEAHALKVENDELRRQLASKGKPTEVKEVKAENGKPTEDSYDSHVDYLEALTDWKADRKIEAAFQKRDKARAEHQARNSRARESTQLEQALHEQVNASKKNRKDWQKVVGVVDETLAEAGLEWNEGQLKSFAMTGEFGEIAYYLGKNPDEAERVAQITAPSSFMLELGKIIEKARGVETKPSEAEKDPEDPEKEEKVAGKRLPKPMGEAVKGTKAGGVKDAEYWATKASPAEYEKAREQGII